MGNPDSQALDTTIYFWLPIAGPKQPGRENSSAIETIRKPLLGSLLLVCTVVSLGGGQLVSPVQAGLPPFQEMIQAFIISTPAKILCAHSHSGPEICPQGLSSLPTCTSERTMWQAGRQDTRKLYCQEIIYFIHNNGEAHDRKGLTLSQGPGHSSYTKDWAGEKTLLFPSKEDCRRLGSRAVGPTCP